MNSHRCHDNHWRPVCMTRAGTGARRLPWHTLPSSDRSSIDSITLQFILWQSELETRSHVINIIQFITENLGSEQWRNGYKLVIIIWGQTQRCGTVCRGRHLLLSCEEFLKTFPQTSVEALIPRLTLIHK